MTATIGDARPASRPADLMDRAIAGDRDAFGELWAYYNDTVFKFIYFRTGNRETARDLLSDTFERALKRLDSFTWQGRDPGAWLVTIARNLVADHFKSGRYRIEVTTDDPGGGRHHHDIDTSREGNPEATTVDYLTNTALWAAVQQLTEDQRQCIVLRYLRGYSVAETAAAMGINIGAAKALQYRAVLALGRLLAGLDDERTPRTAPRPRKGSDTVTFCEGCGAQLPNLLAVCRRPACLTADLDETASVDQLCEATP